MRANSNGVKRDNHAFAGRLYTLRHLETDVSRLRGPTCASVPREDEKLCNAIPNCCVAMGLGEEGSFCLRHGGELVFCPRRTSLHLTPFCPQRAAMNTLTPLCPRRAAKDHEGPRRRSRATAGKATAEGQGQLLLLLSTEGAENTLCSVGSLGAFGYWWAVVRRGRGPMCACVPPVDERLFLVIPSCCVAMGWRNRDLLV